MSEREVVARAAIAGAVGALYGTLLCWTLLGWQGNGDGDFTWMGEAARWILQGENPYARIVDLGYFPYDSPFYYPIMAALVAIPFAGLPKYYAGAAFFGVGSGLMAYAVARVRPWAWPVFVSVPYFMAASVAQWTPWLFAAALLPGLQFVLACKPNLGLAIFLREPTWRGFRSMAWITIIGLAVMPAWPLEWIGNAGSSVRHVPPVSLLPIGLLLVYSFFLWWHGGGRLLAGMAAVPQFIWFYDQAALWLIPRGWVTGLVYAGLSWCGYALLRMELIDMQAAVMGWVYVPAVVYVVYRSRLDWRMGWHGWRML